MNQMTQLTNIYTNKDKTYTHRSDEVTAVSITNIVKVVSRTGLDFTSSIGPIYGQSNGDVYTKGAVVMEKLYVSTTDSTHISFRILTPDRKFRINPDFVGSFWSCGELDKEFNSRHYNHWGMPHYLGSSFCSGNTYQLYESAERNCQTHADRMNLRLELTGSLMRSRNKRDTAGIVIRYQNHLKFQTITTLQMGNFYKFDERVFEKLIPLLQDIYFINGTKQSDLEAFMAPFYKINEEGALEVEIKPEMVDIDYLRRTGYAVFSHLLLSDAEEVGHTAVSVVESSLTRVLKMECCGLELYYDTVGGLMHTNYSSMETLVRVRNGITEVPQEDY